MEYIKCKERKRLRGKKYLRWTIKVLEEYNKLGTGGKGIKDPENDEVARGV